MSGADSKLPFSDIANTEKQFFNIFELGADIKLSVSRLLFPTFNKELFPASMYPKTEIILGSSLQENVGLDKQFFKVNLPRYLFQKNELCYKSHAILRLKF